MDAFFSSAERRLQDLAPFKRNMSVHLLTFSRSVAEFLGFLDVSWDVFANRLREYCGASPCRDLKTMILDLLLISSSLAGPVYQSDCQLYVQLGFVIFATG